MTHRTRRSRRPPRPAPAAADRRPDGDARRAGRRVQRVGRGRAGPRRLRPARHAAADGRGQRRRLPPHGDVDRVHADRRVRHDHRAAACSTPAPRPCSTASSRTTGGRRHDHRAHAWPPAASRTSAPTRGTWSGSSSRSSTTSSATRTRTSRRATSPQRDSLVFVNGLESMVGAMYQQLVERLTERELRAEVMVLGAEAARHAAAVAIMVTGAPEAYVSPQVCSARRRTPTRTGVTPIYAIPTLFGSLAPIPITVGAPNETGTRFSTILETPADNSLHLRRRLQPDGRRLATATLRDRWRSPTTYAVESRRR